MSGPTREIVPRSVSFRRERERSWRRLEALVGRIESSGLRSLTARELAELPVLYRATLSSLAVARSISLDRNAVEYLEALAARAYFAVYGPKETFFQRTARFVGLEFARAVREEWRAVCAAGGVFLAGVVTAVVLMARDPAYYYGFVDAGLAAGRDPTASTEFLREGLFDGGDIAADELGYFSAFLFTHNARVGILAFVTGFLGGVPSAVLLFTTGLMLGGFAGLYHSRGLGLELWSWLLPHGVTELLAVVLCGAGGMLMGAAVVAPGRHTRREALARAGRRASVIVVGAVLMLILAGVIEGVFRQTVQNLGVRYCVVFATTALWVAYFGLAGRRRA